MTVTSLPTAMLDRTPRQIVQIAGQVIPAYSVEAQHGVRQPKGVATIRMPLPDIGLDDLLEVLRDRWLNKPMQAMTGYDEDGGAQTVFSGRVDRLRRSFDENGYQLDVHGIGWASLLDFPSETDIVFPPNSLLYDIVRSLCALRGVPSYGGELITYPESSTPITLGGVEYVDDGNVVIPRRTSPLQWLTGTLDLFGYALCDRPDGMLWWGRVLGAPTTDPVATFAQGVNVFSMSREDDISKMVSWWEVDGASYTDGDGVPVKVRSFPASVVYEPLLDPPGYRRDSTGDDVLVTTDLADAARNVLEINTGWIYEEESWTYAGTPGIQPGEVTRLSSPLLELEDADRWVTQVDHNSSERGIRTTWTGWASLASSDPAGNDSLAITVFTDPQHIGNEYLSHYAHPSPQGKVITFDIVVPATYTALVLSGWAHGVNSFLADGQSTEETVSKIEVWQGTGDKPVGSATLPSMPENLNKHYPYGTPLPANWQKYWTRFRLPVPGRLEVGTATVKLISGKSSKYSYDDYEVRGLTLTVTGSGEPELPPEGS